MKIKLDENISVSLVPVLQQLGHDVDTVLEEGFGGQPDDAVWEAAKNEHRLLITQDLDFSDNKRFQPDRHSGILLLRLHEPGRKKLMEYVSFLFHSEDVNHWIGHLVIASEQRLRIR